MHWLNVKNSMQADLCSKHNRGLARKPVLFIVAPIICRGPVFGSCYLLVFVLQVLVLQSS